MYHRVRTPELPQNNPWLNTEKPLSLKSLRGRIVILDFWTYCCINCLHILPDLKYLENKYSENLTIIGIHSGKFDNEKEIENIRQAVLRHEIKHPILVDNNLWVWENYTIKAWPTLIIIDPDGYIVGRFAGEGNLERIENLIINTLNKHQNNLKKQKLEFQLEQQEREFTNLLFPGHILATVDGLFIADSGNNRIVMTTLEGKIMNLIGEGRRGLKDGEFQSCQFSHPQGMNYDQTNQILYLADTENHAIRKINLQSQTVETIAGNGKQSRIIYPHGGKSLEIELNSPWDLVKINNYLFITMAGSHQIWQMNLATNTIHTYAGSGAEGCVDSNFQESAFAQPSGITTNGNKLFIADSETSSIRSLKISDSGHVQTICGGGFLFGFGDIDGVGDDVRLQHCLDVDYFDNHLYIADTYNHKIKLVNLDNSKCTNLLPENINWCFSEPSGLSYWDSHLYICDTNNHAILRIELSKFEVFKMELFGWYTSKFCSPQN
ncbi:MAG: redoxin domain-containing protein [Sphaerospermopsis sp. SIO1G2]|nr:redoxin domain-containing protein [Sphaerospermopsis sp. SIO1G2]